MMLTPSYIGICHTDEYTRSGKDPEVSGTLAKIDDFPLKFVRRRASFQLYWAMREEEL